MALLIALTDNWGSLKSIGLLGPSDGHLDYLLSAPGLLARDLDLGLHCLSAHNLLQSLCHIGTDNEKGGTPKMDRPNVRVWRAPDSQNNKPPALPGTEGYKNNKSTSNRTGQTKYTKPNGLRKLTFRDLEAAIVHLLQQGEVV